MFKKFAIVLLSTGLLGLTACHTCPEKGDFTSGPYSDRTAGSGKAVHYQKCHWGGERDSYAYGQEKTKASDGKMMDK